MQFLGVVISCFFAGRVQSNGARAFDLTGNSSTGIFPSITPGQVQSWKVSRNLPNLALPGSPGCCHSSGDA